MLFRNIHPGGKDVVYTNYNFTGQVTQTTILHNHGQSNQIKLATAYEYDHQGRPVKETLKVNQEDDITLAAWKYNQLGEQVVKYLHGSSSGSNFNQQVDYTYNEKGWLRRQNSIADPGRDLFTQELRYSDSGSGYYNGNIRQTGWLSTGSIAKNYTFSYDSLSRLKTALYADGISDGHFNTGYSYDANGNISTLSRKADNVEIDALGYFYLNNGNKLQSVTDGGTNDGYFAVAEDYTYDANGNMNSDPSKGTTIKYNYLNLPKEVSFGANDNLRYTYDATGNKLTKTVELDGNAEIGRTDYSGSFLYENNDLKAIFTSEGRIIPFDNNGEVVYKFEYSLKDHLGNSRVVFSGHSNGMPEVMQVTDYYPFGLIMNQQNYFADGVLDNKYLYNGKELQDDELAGNSLGWYDYGARFYDAELGRWHVVDPMAKERYWLTPYNYVQNNPLLRIDPDGRLDDIIDIEKSSGKINVTQAAGDDVVRLVDNGSIKDSYTYGSNGSFTSENVLEKSDKVTTITSTNSDKAETFYRFAAGSDVEFGKLDVQSPTGENISVVTTSHDRTQVSTLPGIAIDFSNRGFTGIKQSHSHPRGESIPSGHYGYEKGNPYSLMPYTINGKKVDDAGNAVGTRSLNGFGNTKFEIYNPVNKTKSIYDGVHRTQINIPL